MSLSIYSVFEVRTTGSDLNGGGFVAGASGTDYSQQDTAQASGTGMSVHASTATDVLPNGLTPAAAHVGNIIHITAGTGFTAGWYQIMSIQSGYWRLDRSPGAVGITGGTWALGGALATPGGAALAASNGVANSSMRIFVKSGTYTFAQTAKGYGGQFSPTTAANLTAIGYDTNRHDLNTDANRPVLHAGALTSFTMVANINLINFDLNGNGNSAVNGPTGGGSYTCTRCHFTGFAGIACATSTMHCTASGNTGSPVFNLGNHLFTVASGNAIAANAAAFANYNMACGCIAANNTGNAASAGFQPAAGMTVNCLAYGNAGHGFNVYGYALASFENCIAASNAGVGFRVTTYGQARWFRKCAAYYNSGGTFSLGTNAPLPPSYDHIILSESPFVDAAGGNFALNDSAFGGYQLRNVGVPDTLVGAAGGTAHYADVGPARHQDPAAGGGGTQGGAFTYVG